MFTIKNIETDVSTGYLWLFVGDCLRRLVRSGRTDQVMAPRWNEPLPQVEDSEEPAPASTDLVVA